MYRNLTTAIVFLALATARGRDQQPSQPDASDMGTSDSGSADLDVGSDVETGVQLDVAPDLEPEDLSTGVMRITFADVGQGDGILIELGDTDIIVDVGIDGLRVPLSSPVELLFVTHPHRDHYGEAVRLLQTEQVLRVITNGEQRGHSRGELA